MMSHISIKDNNEEAVVKLVSGHIPQYHCLIYGVLRPTSKIPSTVRYSRL
jgi:hypothetical protein